MALAGCIGSDDAPDDDPMDDPSASGLIAWSDPVLVGPGGDAETSIFAGPEGTVLVCTHGGFQKASPAWASRDGGASWDKLVIEPNPLVSGDCDFTILADGTWVMVFDTIASATVATSDDSGESWFLNYLSALPIAVDRPWLAGEGDTIHMIYADVMAVEPAINMYATSTDGLVWDHQPMALIESLDTYTHVLGDILLRDDGVYVPITRDNKQLGIGPTAMDLRISTDGGSSWAWKHVATSDSPFWLGSIDEDASGRIWAALPSGPGGDTSLQLGFSDDDGTTWTWSDTLASGQDLPGVTGFAVIGMDHTTGAAAVWMDYNETAGGWGARAIAIDEHDGKWIIDGPHDISHRGGTSGDLYEFIDVDVDDDGILHAAILINDGPECADVVFQPGRNVQCLYVTSGQWLA